MRHLKPVKNRAVFLSLLFAACGFALAQPIYNLLLISPEFLSARQNTASDLWVLAAVLSFLVPLLLALPAWLTFRKRPGFSSAWSWLAAGFVLALFFAQLFKPALGGQWILFLLCSAVCGAVLAWPLLYTRWAALSMVLAGLAVLFPLWFLLFSPINENMDRFAAVQTQRLEAAEPLPDIVFVILDELPLATLLNNELEIDARLFPGFARLQSMSDWYDDMVSVSAGTFDAVPSILTGFYPDRENQRHTIAEQPVNLFTLLRHHYRYNAFETITRLCPQADCPRSDPGMLIRVRALLLDLAAIYLHRVVPDLLAEKLPDVSNNWSGFFAERQQFFPQGKMQNAGHHETINRPEHIRAFARSVSARDQPGFNFLHVLFPHGPYAYFPEGGNYGHEWMRGFVKSRWQDHEWGITSGLQRQYLQVMYADRLVNELLDHLQEKSMLDNSLVVVVSDHGFSFSANKPSRSVDGSDAAATLKVPFFIKHPGQTQPRRFSHRAMTVDILPTLISALGFPAAGIHTDGIDLTAVKQASPRQRRAFSVYRESIDLDESDLELGPLVNSYRSLLKLDDPDHALWTIGPFDEFRGKPLTEVCAKDSQAVRVTINDFNPLADEPPENSIPAYVNGRFTGKGVTLDSKPFLITSQDLVVASGYTWEFNDRSRFFALVEPGFVKQADWSPTAWYLENGKCFGAKP